MQEQQTPVVITTNLPAALAEFSAIESKLDAAKQAYMPMIIQGPDDVNGYLKVDDARKKVKKARTTIEGKRKELVAPAVEFQRAVNEKAKSITARLEPIERHLQSEVDRIDLERENIREAEKIRRITEIKEAGFVFDGIAYTAGMVAIVPGSVIDLTPEEFAHIIENGKREVERIRAEKIAEAEERRKRDEELDRLRQESAKRDRELAEMRAKLAAEEAAATPDMQIPQTGPATHAAPPTQRIVASDRSERFPATDEQLPAALQPAAEPAPIRHAYTMGWLDAIERICDVFLTDTTARKRAEWAEVFKSLRP